MKMRIAVAAGVLSLFAVLAPAAQAAPEPAPGEPAPSAEVTPGQDVDAGASAPDSSCPSTYFCFWPYNNYQGPRGKVAGDNPDFRAFRQSACSSGTWDNCIQSIKNSGRQCTVYMYSGYRYTGIRHSLGRGDGVPNISRWVSDGFANNISSNKWCNP
ncbi:peptidase inhibitor family I36 protein [Nocardia transvalensis]|nr:peptidase inhibitor family I36 protein [Nocardia transvalensis]